MIDATDGADGPVQKRNRRKYADYARQLHALSDRPENFGRTWNWVDIGMLLGVSAATAQHIVQWMRKNYTEQYWTVGTYRSDYLTTPTKQARMAMDGMLNQLRHLVTRLQTMVQGSETLARIDPDPAWQNLMDMNAQYYKSLLTMAESYRELLLNRAERLGWSAEPEPATA